MHVRRLGTVRSKLGEGPYWDVRGQALFFVDIRGYKLWRYDPTSQDFQSWETPVQPAAISRTVDDRFVAVLADGFYEFSLETGRFDLLARVELEPGEVQLNDAKVDRQGRFVAGGTTNGQGSTAALYSFDGEQVTKLDTGYSICNGPCWSPDGKTFYLSDTIPNVIYAYDYDSGTGGVSNRRVLADVSSVGGYADGATVDTDGRMWQAFCGQGKILVLNPDGSTDRVLSTEVQWVSSVQFGGPELDQLYASSFVSTRPGAGDENSGYLYVIEDLGVKGIAEPLARPFASHRPSLQSLPESAGRSGTGREASDGSHAVRAGRWLDFEGVLYDNR
jgi:sugar lactone lactonase YvrE